MLSYLQQNNGLEKMDQYFDKCICLTLFTGSIGSTYIMEIKSIKKGQGGNPELRVSSYFHIYG